MPLMLFLSTINSIKNEYEYISNCFKSTKSIMIDDLDN